MLVLHSRTRSRNHIRMLLGAVALAASAVLAGGCSESSGAGGTGGTDAGAQAMLRIVHASPDAPAVDVYPAGQVMPLATSLAYGQSTDYIQLPAGTYKVDLRAAGASPSDPPAYTSGDISVMGGRSYTAIATGLLASSDSADSFRILPLEEDFGAASAGNLRVRIVHAGVDAPTVGLDVGNDDPSAPEVTGLARFADTGAAGLELPAGQPLQVGVVAGGSTVTAFSTPALPEGADVFVIASGELSKLPRQDSGFALLALPGGSTTAWIRQNPRIHALHASPDGGPVDIYAGDTELVDNASFGDMATVQVPPGSYTLDFFPGQPGTTPRPAGEPAASATTPMLDAGQSYLAIAAGELTASPSTFQLLAFKEGFVLTDRSNARIRMVHASADTAAVDLGPVISPGKIGTPIIQNLAFGEATPEAGLSLPPATLTLGGALAGTTSTLAEFDFTTTAGQRAIAVAAGKFGAKTNPFQLLVVDTTATSWSATAVLPNKQDED